MRSNRGFTLMELMIVVAVVAILSMIAIPSYIEYTRKGKRSEGVAAIGDVQMREERYRADNPTYGSMTQLFGSTANANSYNSKYKYYSLTISNQTATGYTLTATRKGDLLNDPKCGNLRMTVAAGVSTKSLFPVNASQNDYCWRQ